MAVRTRVAAGTTPTPGSVTQGSAVIQGVTADKISVRFLPASDRTRRQIPGLYPAHPVVSIRKAEGETVTSNTNPRRWQAHLDDNGQVVYFDPYVEDPPPDSSWFDQTVVAPLGGAFADEFSQPGAGRVRPVRFLQVNDVLGGGSFGYELVPVSSGVLQGKDVVYGNPSGMAVQGLTDYEHGAGDYTSFGFWVLYEYTPTDLEYTLGAFSDGMETAHAEIPSAGTATYAGYASGLAMTGVLDEDEYATLFRGRVQLTADFASGSVAGAVDDFRLYDPDPQPGVVASRVFQGLVVHLEGAGIGAAGTASFFAGDTRTTGALAGATGKWGGQFYGTPATGAAPPTVGGTWGVTQGDGADDWNLIGGFGAWNAAGP